MKTSLLCLALSFLCCGCTSLSKIVKELAKDPATASLRVTTIYGTVDFKRSNVSSNHTAYLQSDGSIVIGNIGHNTNVSAPVMLMPVPPPPAPPLAPTPSRVLPKPAEPYIVPLVPAPNSAP